MEWAKADPSALEQLLDELCAAFDGALDEGTTEEFEALGPGARAFGDAPRTHAMRSAQAAGEAREALRTAEELQRQVESELAAAAPPGSGAACLFAALATREIDFCASDAAERVAKELLLPHLRPSRAVARARSAGLSALGAARGDDAPEAITEAALRGALGEGADGGPGPTERAALGGGARALRECGGADADSSPLRAALREAEEFLRPRAADKPKLGGLSNLASVDVSSPVSAEEIRGLCAVLNLEDASGPRVTSAYARRLAASARALADARDALVDRREVGGARLAAALAADTRSRPAVATRASSRHRRGAPKPRFRGARARAAARAPRGRDAARRRRRERGVAARPHRRAGRGADRVGERRRARARGRSRGRRGAVTAAAATTTKATEPCASSAGTRRAATRLRRAFLADGPWSRAPADQAGVTPAAPASGHWGGELRSVLGRELIPTLRTQIKAADEAGAADAPRWGVAADEMRLVLRHVKLTDALGALRAALAAPPADADAPAACAPRRSAPAPPPRSRGPRRGRRKRARAPRAGELVARARRAAKGAGRRARLRPRGRTDDEDDDTVAAAAAELSVARAGGSRARGRLCRDRARRGRGSPTAPRA